MECPCVQWGQLAQLCSLPASCATLAVWQVKALQRRRTEVMWGVEATDVSARKMLVQSHSLNGSMGLLQLAIRQVLSWVGWGTWDMTCSSVTDGVKRAAGSDDSGSHSFATGFSAWMLLISLIQGARQGWCQLQHLERKGLPMKQMW